jgi:hypothetical protein
MALENAGQMFRDFRLFRLKWRAGRVSRLATSLGNRRTIPRVKTTLQFPED